MPTSFYGHIRWGVCPIQPMTKASSLGNNLHTVAPFIPVAFVQVKSEIHRPGRVVYVFLSNGETGRPSRWGRIGIRLTILGGSDRLGIRLAGRGTWLGIWLTGRSVWGCGVGRWGRRHFGTELGALKGTAKICTIVGTTDGTIDREDDRDKIGTEPVQTAAKGRVLRL